MTEQTEGNPNSAPKGTDGFKDEPLMKFFTQLQKVSDDDRSLILVTNGFLELLVETLIKAKCKNAKRITEDKRSYPYSAKLLILNESGILPEMTFHILDWFRGLRNRAAHEPFFTVTPQDLEKFNFGGPKELHHICITIIGSFWNNHFDVLGPVFAPSLAALHDATEKIIRKHLP